MTAFHRRLTVYSAGGPFLDGYVLGIVGIALTQLTPAWQLSGVWQGLLAAAALIGMFAGGLVGGYVTDRIGRQVMYTLDLILIVVCSVAQFFADGPVWLLIARLVTGVAIGADYPIATALQAEFAPRAKRGSLLGWLTAMWAAGNVAAYLIGDAIAQFGPDSWRWMLLSPAVPALILVMARWGTPESPRWLASRGRTDEARSALVKALGPGVELPDHMAEPDHAGLRDLTGKPYLRRTIFIAIFWTCSIWPIYAIYAFGPAMLEAFRLNSPGQSTVGSAMIGVLFLIGCVVATLFANRIGRRRLLIVPFTIATIALLALGIWPDAPTVVIALMFTTYAIAIGSPTIMQWIYPNELFPTAIRATAVGIGTAISRVGAALGTFLTPLLLAHTGIGPTMLIAGIISAVGVVASIVMAPETRGRDLHHASGADGT
ncbi:MFS transporter [Nocardia amamiensis]|uniref:MFS transporter n=1 Tax=Nocardia amamiensis TaxID=404578 RepID=UPI001FE0A56D|nr:MFS transporter [Nocardia amamiensis]